MKKSANIHSFIKYTLALFITLILVCCNNGNNTSGVANSNKKSSEDIQNLDKGVVLKKIRERRIYEAKDFYSNKSYGAHYVDVECSISWPVLIDGKRPNDLQDKIIEMLFDAEPSIGLEEAMNNYLALPDSILDSGDFFDISKASVIDSIPKNKSNDEMCKYAVIGDVYNLKDGKFVVFDCYFFRKGDGEHIDYGDIFLIYDIEQERVVSLDDLVLPSEKRKLYTLVDQGLKRDYGSVYDSLAWNSKYNPNNLIDNLLIDVNGTLCMSFPPFFIGGDLVGGNMHVGLPTANVAPILTDTGRRLLGLSNDNKK